jgi:hypothetical protein
MIATAITELNPVVQIAAIAAFAWVIVTFIKNA